MARILALSVLAATLAPGLAGATVNDSTKDTMSRHKISTTSTHTLSVDMSAGVNFAAGDTIIFSWKSSGGNNWAFPTNATWATGDFTFNDGSARTVVATGATPSCSAGANNVTVTADATNYQLTVTACTSYTSSSNGATITFDVGSSAFITNPSVAGSYEIWVTGTYGDALAAAEVPILTDDQVVVSGTVDTYISADATTSNGSDGNIGMGELKFSAVTSSNDATRTNAAGATLPADNISLTLDTNAYYQTLVQVKSANGGLKSTVAGNTTITSTAGAQEALAANANNMAGSAGFGLQAQTAAATVGTLTKQTPYDGSSNTIGGVDTTFRTLYSTAGSTTTSQIVGGTATVYVIAVPAKDTPAAYDYTDTLTFRFTSTF